MIRAIASPVESGLKQTHLVPPSTSLSPPYSSCRLGGPTGERGCWRSLGHQTAQLGNTGTGRGASKLPDLIGLFKACIWLGGGRGRKWGGEVRACVRARVCVCVCVFVLTNLDSALRVTGSDEPGVGRHCYCGRTPRTLCCRSSSSSSSCNNNISRRSALPFPRSKLGYSSCFR